MSLYLLDTNAVGELIRARANRALVGHAQRHIGQLCTASPAVHELLFGAERLQSLRRRRELEGLLGEALSGLVVLPYDDMAARWHARERARLVAKGRTPPIIDGQIAAIAAVNDAVLVTANVKDFSAFDGLSVENWLK
ncbi:MAG: type II toxin-antitoxin system VapC family toxin [Polyangiaceae bacterium]